MRTLPDILHEENGVYVLDFHELTQELKNKIDNQLIKLVEGPLYSKVNSKKLKTVKLKMIEFINQDENKNYWTKRNKGYIAELLAHLLLVDDNAIYPKFKQEFIFQNLEENSPKKGFDGMYSIEEEIWILESKSSQNDTHLTSINKAYTDIKEKLNGKNNPWRNAYSHAKQLDVNNLKTSIVELLDELSDNFTHKVFENIESHNIILSGTYYTKSTNEHQNKSIVSNNIKNIKNKPSKDCIPIAITCRLLDQIIEYIKDGAT